MMQELKKFYDTLQEKHAEVLNQDVEAIVAERLQEAATRIRKEVQDEVKADALILEIKMEAITDAMKVIATNTTESETTLAPRTEDTEII